MNDFNKPLDGKKQLQGMMNDTPTPRTDEFIATWDFYNDWFEAIDHSRTLERELTAVTEERDEALSDLQFRRDLYSLQTKQLDDAREQRDRLAEVLRKIKNEGGRFNDPYDELDFIDGITYEALQSLTPNNDR
jgi:hypothetical protein